MSYIYIPDTILPALSRLSGPECQVLLAIARYFDAEGVAWPSRRRIAEESGLAKTSTVDRAIKGLERAGVLRVERGGHGGSGPAACNHYYWAGDKEGKLGASDSPEAGMGAPAEAAPGIDDRGDDGGGPDAALGGPSGGEWGPPERGHEQPQEQPQTKTPNETNPRELPIARPGGLDALRAGSASPQEPPPAETQSVKAVVPPAVPSPLPAPGRAPSRGRVDQSDSRGLAGRLTSEPRLTQDVRSRGPGELSASALDPLRVRLALGWFAWSGLDVKPGHACWDSLLERAQVPAGAVRAILGAKGFRGWRESVLVAYGLIALSARRMPPMAYLDRALAHGWEPTAAQVREAEGILAGLVEREERAREVEEARRNWPRFADEIRRVLPGWRPPNEQAGDTRQGAG